MIFHSDRGCQYTSAAFAALAEDCQVVLSLGRTGQCWDNALAESFFSSLKGELIDQRAWPTRAGARRAIVEYIGWYNGTRLHSTLGYLSPAEFETTTSTKNHQASSLTSHQPCPSKPGRRGGRAALRIWRGAAGCRLARVAAAPWRGCALMLVAGRGS